MGQKKFQKRANEVIEKTEKAYFRLLQEIDSDPAPSMVLERLKKNFQDIQDANFEALNPSNGKSGRDNMNYARMITGTMLNTIRTNIMVSEAPSSFMCKMEDRVEEIMSIQKKAERVIL